VKLDAKPSLRPPSPRQRQILVFIGKEIREKGLPPTLREIGAHLGVRSRGGSLKDHVDALLRKGYVERAHNLSRGIAPSRRGWAEIAAPGAADGSPGSSPDDSALPLPAGVVRLPVVSRLERGRSPFDCADASIRTSLAEPGSDAR
jgi:repressor LexA